GAGRRRLTAGVLILAALVATLLNGFDAALLIAALLAVAGALWSGWSRIGRMSAWGGLITLMLVLAVAVQAIAPTAAFILAWPVLGAALAAAVGTLIDPRLERHVSLWPAVTVTAVLGGWLLVYGHSALLSIGMDMPGHLAVFALLIAMLARPLAPVSRRGLEVLAVVAAVALIAGAGLALSARIIEPIAAGDAP